MDAFAELNGDCLPEKEHDPEFDEVRGGVVWCVCRNCRKPLVTGFEDTNGR